MFVSFAFRWMREHGMGAVPADKEGRFVLEDRETQQSIHATILQKSSYTEVWEWDTDRIGMWAWHNELCDKIAKFENEPTWRYHLMKCVRDPKPSAFANLIVAW